MTETKGDYKADTRAVGYVRYLMGGGKSISGFGERVIKVLDFVFGGIHHVSNTALSHCGWDNKRMIDVIIKGTDWSTYDYDTLTKLVFCAHHYCVRVELNPLPGGNMLLLFFNRDRSVDMFERHATLDEAVTSFKKMVTDPEYGVPASVKHYKIIGAYTGKQIGWCAEGCQGDVLAEEPGATFIEGTEEEYQEWLKNEG